LTFTVRICAKDSSSVHQSDRLSPRKSIGLPYNKVGKNPISGWTDSWMKSESVQVAPQEHEITSYKISASVNDLDDFEFKL